LALVIAFVVGFGVSNAAGTDEPIFVTYGAGCAGVHVGATPSPDPAIVACERQRAEERLHPPTRRVGGGQAGLAAFAGIVALAGATRRVRGRKS
jgi:hypothetical protein